MAKGIKTGGRIAGTPNKTTEEIKELIIQFVSNNIDTVQADFEKLEPKDKLYFFDKMLKYIIPTGSEGKANIDQPTCVIELPIQYFKQASET